MRQYYAVLGLTERATLQEIKIAYRELAKKHHPDVGGKTEIFQAISEAYHILIKKPAAEPLFDPDDMFWDWVKEQRAKRPQYNIRDAINIRLEATLGELLAGRKVVIRGDYAEACICRGISRKCPECDGLGYIVKLVDIVGTIRLDVISER